MYQVVWRSSIRKSLSVNNNTISDSVKLFSTEVNKKQKLSELAQQHNFTQLNDYYKLTSKDLEKLGTWFRNEYNSSPIQLLSALYPDQKWLPWKFESCPRNFWAEVGNQRMFFDWAATELKLKKPSDWYHVSNQTLQELGAGLLRYHESLYNALSTAYPEHEWLPWKFDFCPRNFWSETKNQRAFMDWAANKLQIKDMNDWYTITIKNLVDLGGITLALRYSSSIYKLLSNLYPEHKWLPWKFVSCPRNFWSSAKNRKDFMDWAGKELKIKEMADWYNVSFNDLVELGGRRLLDQHSLSLYKLLSAIYPEYEWIPWKFQRIGSAGWEKSGREFMDLVGKELNIKNKEDWYKVTKEDISGIESGSRILRVYNFSVFRLLTGVYTEYPWLPFEFPAPKLQYWLDTNNWKLFLDAVSFQLNIKEFNDWYKIKAEQIIDFGGSCLLVNQHSLPNLLSRVYPKYNWDTKLFIQNSNIWKDEQCANYLVERLKKQNNDNELAYLHKMIIHMNHRGSHILTQLLKDAFPKYTWANSLPSIGRRAQYILKESITRLLAGENTVLLEEYKHPEMENLELDYFFPQFNIAFEYQGRQHFHSVDVFDRLDQLDGRKKRDIHKVDACKQLGITLVQVPYWWDRHLESLEATVYNLRPDLFDAQPQGKAIPLTPPQEDSAALKSKQAARKLLMTATEWDFDTMEPTGWYMTEKYDGMRLYWTGTQFYSRPGEKVNVPKSITEQLPPVALDGELWTQYGLYQDAVTLVRTTNEEKWNKAIFWVFDSPQIAEKPLEERIDYLKNLNLPAFAKVVDFVKCTGKDHLKQYTDAILAKGGEGVMLREPGSVYKGGRSTSLRRHKPYFDAEVRVIKNQYPHGLTCEQPNGKILFVRIIENPEEAKIAKTGSVITVKHSGANVHGTFQYPHFYRARLDVKWTDLVNKSL